MKKRIVVGLVLVLVLLGSVGVFAADTMFPWMTSYNKPGHIAVDAGVGYYWGGLDVVVGAEFIIGQFDIAGIPLEWGIMAQGILGFASYGFTSGLDWGAAPMVSLHWGVNFGGMSKFDFFVSAGLGIYGGSYWSYYNAGAVGFGFASYEGVVWMFSNNFGLFAEYGYIGWTSTGAVGIDVKI